MDMILMGFIYVNLRTDSLRSHMDFFLSIGALGIGGGQEGGRETDL